MRELSVLVYFKREVDDMSELDFVQGLDPFHKQMFGNGFPERVIKILKMDLKKSRTLKLNQNTWLLANWRYVVALQLFWNICFHALSKLMFHDDAELLCIVEMVALWIFVFEKLSAVSVGYSGELLERMFYRLAGLQMAFTMIYLLYVPLILYDVYFFDKSKDVVQSVVITEWLFRIFFCVSVALFIYPFIRLPKAKTIEVNGNPSELKIWILLATGKEVTIDTKKVEFAFCEDDDILLYPRSIRLLGRKGIYVTDREKLRSIDFTDRSHPIVLLKRLVKVVKIGEKRFVCRYGEWREVVPDCGNLNQKRRKH